MNEAEKKLKEAHRLSEDIRERLSFRGWHGYYPEPEGTTCGTCGRSMRYNVPRLGESGGFVHLDGKVECPSPIVGDMDG